jgi:hypothetical protein
VIILVIKTAQNSAKISLTYAKATVGNAAEIGNSNGKGIGGAEVLFDPDFARNPMSSSFYTGFRTLERHAKRRGVAQVETDHEAAAPKPLNLTILTGQRAGFRDLSKIAESNGGEPLKLIHLDHISPEQIDGIRSAVKRSGLLWFGDDRFLDGKIIDKAETKLRSIFAGENVNIYVDPNGFNLGFNLAASVTYKRQYLSNLWGAGVVVIVRKDEPVPNIELRH